MVKDFIIVYLMETVNIMCMDIYVHSLSSTPHASLIRSAIDTPRHFDTQI